MPDVFRILFHEPRIAGNTGAAIRLAAVTGAELHLVEPLGFDMEQFTDSLTPMKGGVFSDLGSMLTAITPGALVIAIVCMALLLIWERPIVKRNPVLSKLPGPLLAVMTGIGLAQLGGIFPFFAMEGTHFVQLPDLTRETAAALFAGPDWSGITSVAVWTVALTMALVASLETLLSVEAIDKLDPHKRVTPTNRELIAQGVGNTLAGLIGALPLTQVIVRSSANVQAGGNSKVSTMLHGVWILVAVTIFPALLRQIPLAALAAILVQVGLKLAKPALFKEMWQGGWKMFMPFIITVAGVLFFDLLKGVSLGLAVALFIILRNNYKVPFHLLERAVAPGEPIRIALGEEVSFLNKANIQRALSEMPANTHIIIDASRTGGLLELSFPNGSKIVVNTQPPLQELWLAARGGGFHYRWADGHWLDTRDESEFFEVLSQHASVQGGKPLRFEA